LLNVIRPETYVLSKDSESQEESEKRRWVI
jgi:hypothetical protein